MGRRYDALLVAAALDQDSQSDPRQLVGERDCQNVAIKTPAAVVSHGPGPCFAQLGASEQNGAGAFDEEHTQIAVCALRDAAKDGAITGRHLFRHQAKPSGKVSPFVKAVPLPTAATVALAMIGPMPGTLINCPQFTSVRARPSISSVTLSMRSSRYLQSSTVSSYDPEHPR